MCTCGLPLMDTSSPAPLQRFGRPGEGDGPLQQGCVQREPRTHKNLGPVGFGGMAHSGPQPVLI